MALASVAEGRLVEGGIVMSIAKNKGRAGFPFLKALHYRRNRGLHASACIRATQREVQKRRAALSPVSRGRRGGDTADAGWVTSLLALAPYALLCEQACGGRFPRYREMRKQNQASLRVTTCGGSQTVS